MAEYKSNPNPRTPKSADTPKRNWTAVIITLAAVVLGAAAMIFSAAGPDRTRTGEVNNSNAVPAQVGTSQPAESGIPPSGQDAPRTTPAPTVVPQKSNPAGTQ